VVCIGGIAVDSPAVEMSLRHFSGSLLASQACDRLRLFTMIIMMTATQWSGTRIWRRQLCTLLHCHQAESHLRSSLVSFAWLLPHREGVWPGVTWIEKQASWCHGVNAFLQWLELAEAALRKNELCTCGTADCSCISQSTSTHCMQVTCTRAPSGSKL
jgi:hypothetical protein